MAAASAGTKDSGPCRGGKPPVGVLAPHAVIGDTGRECEWGRISDTVSVSGTRGATDHSYTLVSSRKRVRPCKGGGPWARDRRAGNGARDTGNSDCRSAVVSGISATISTDDRTLGDRTPKGPAVRGRGAIVASARRRSAPGCGCRCCRNSDVGASTIEATDRCCWSVAPGGADAGPIGTSMSLMATQTVGAWWGQSCFVVASRSAIALGPRGCSEILITIHFFSISY